LIFIAEELAYLLLIILEVLYINFFVVKERKVVE